MMAKMSFLEVMSISTAIVLPLDIPFVPLLSNSNDLEIVMVGVVVIVVVVLFMNRYRVVDMTFPTSVTPNEMDIIMPLNVRLVLMSFTIVVVLCMNQYNVVVARNIPTYVRRNELDIIHDNVRVVSVPVEILVVVTEPIFLFFVMDNIHIITYVWQRRRGPPNMIVLTTIVVVVVVITMMMMFLSYCISTSLL